MALSSNYVQVYGQLGDFFRRISEGQAPDKFTRQYLRDLGFGSSNFRAVIPLLKTLGFLTDDGTPTRRYLEYRNTAKSRSVMGEALKEAYSDLFTIKEKPTDADRELIEGKFRSVHNATAVTSRLMASTFYALLGLADIDAKTDEEKRRKETDEQLQVAIPPPSGNETAREPRAPGTSLHYNIQIHLPATKDVEVYNAIFKSLKGHLLE
ncbi:MAG TPA: DUF5343 domain-containing protein [Terriglobales bacterium]|jgi:hypothetical protein|nr:DUF5343 domain-containing protein [Terriglobales bacterium]